MPFLIYNYIIQTIFKSVNPFYKKVEKRQSQSHAAINL
nr:MAG TPA: hypothetical protein [Caudoviricetes sp.]